MLNAHILGARSASFPQKWYPLYIRAVHVNVKVGVVNVWSVCVQPLSPQPISDALHELRSHYRCILKLYIHYPAGTIHLNLHVT